MPFIHLITGTVTSVVSIIRFECCKYRNTAKSRARVQVKTDQNTGSNRIIPPTGSLHYSLGLWKKVEQ
ncbi:MAG: hypothetical protein CVV34_01830 [Methanomicrobiales archaeon HGW-Methanomicrobiales-5]|nr:MAG: hypothetical protein CVV34_01830 [Methanomicrobiales archaeon HGW-Methanomicrobiales-5]